jgi:uncharacterized FlaG/YvyC family protein
MLSGIENTTNTTVELHTSKIEMPEPMITVEEAEVVAQRISVKAETIVKQEFESLESTLSLDDIQLDMQELAQKINEGVKAFSDKISFGYDKSLNQMIVFVNDGAFGKMVKQLPSAEMVEFLHRMRDAIEGLLLDETI